MNTFIIISILSIAVCGLTVQVVRLSVRAYVADEVIRNLNDRIERLEYRK